MFTPLIQHFESYVESLVTVVISDALDDNHVMTLELAQDFEKRIIAVTHALRMAVSDSHERDSLINSLAELYELVGAMIHVSGKILFENDPPPNQGGSDSLPG